MIIFICIVIIANIIGIDCCAQSAFIRLNPMNEEKKNTFCVRNYAPNGAKRTNRQTENNEIDIYSILPSDDKVKVNNKTKKGRRIGCYAEKH